MAFTGQRRRNRCCWLPWIRSFRPIRAPPGSVTSTARACCGMNPPANGNSILTTITPRLAARKLVWRKTAAISRRGTFQFAHSLDKPLLSDWPNPDVAKVGGRYFCFSDAPGYTAAKAPPGKEVSPWQHRQLAMAQSDDGLHWEKKYFFDPDPGIDANHVPQTFVCRREGKWWLYVFYTTQVGWRRRTRNILSFEPMTTTGSMTRFATCVTRSLRIAKGNLPCFASAFFHFSFALFPDLPR